MRQASILVGTILFLMACNNPSSTNIQSQSDTSSRAITYAYTTNHKPNWEVGDPKHTSFALSALKKYETGNLDALKEDLADTVSFYGDGLEFKGSSDSLINIFKRDWENTKSIKIEMEDWESVHGKDNNEDWVSMWYKTIWTGKNGKVDSMFYMDDVKIQNGKIQVIDSKGRKFAAKK